jgi:hypothetical protein
VYPGGLGRRHEVCLGEIDPLGLDSLLRCLSRDIKCVWRTPETGARLSRRGPVPRRNQKTEEERVAPRPTPSALGIVALFLGLGDRQA